MLEKAYLEMRCLVAAAGSSAGDARSTYRSRGSQGKPFHGCDRLPLGMDAALRALKRQAHGHPVIPKRSWKRLGAAASSAYWLLSSFPAKERAREQMKALATPSKPRLRVRLQHNQ